MKTRNIFMAAVMAIVVMAVTTVTAAETPDTARQSVQAYLVVDTSPATRDVAPEMRAVAQAAIKALVAGDRLWIVSAHADRPRLRAITTIRSEEVDFTLVLEEIKPARLLDADLAAALDVVIASLRGNAAEAPRCLVIVLTDGTMHDDSAERLQTKMLEIETLGGRVFCTGLERTSRKLLMAAAQGQVRWSRLTECDPAKWLADTRQAVPSATLPASPPAVAQASAVTGEATPSPPPAAEEPTAAAKPAPSAAPEPARVPAPAAPGQSNQPTPPPSSHTTNIPTLPAGPPYRPSVPAAVGSPSPSVSETSPPRMAAGAADRAIPPAPSRAPDQEAPPAPLPSPAGTSPSSPTPDTALGESQTPNVPVKPPSLRQGPAEVLRSGAASLRPEPLGKTSPESGRAPPPAGLDLPDPKADINKDDSLTRPLPPPPNLPSAAFPATAPDGKTVPGSQTSKTPPPAPTAPAVPADTTNTQRVASRRSFSPFLYIVVATTLGFGAVLAAVAAAIRKQARSALHKQTRSPDGKTKPDRRELFAVANGQELTLGPWVEVRSLTFGSGPDATIVLNGEGVLPRHAVLTRDGETVRLRNLSRQPLVANGVTIAPRRRAYVSLPLDLTVTEAVKVALRVRTLERAPATSAKGGTPHVQTALEH